MTLEQWQKGRGRFKRASSSYKPSSPPESELSRAYEKYGSCRTTAHICLEHLTDAFDYFSTVWPVDAQVNVSPWQETSEGCDLKDPDRGQFHSKEVRLA